jgi:eukaryotic-like serine/threonine-protein kinase
MPPQIEYAMSYMAPELIEGQSGNAASDQYALAIMIYEWLCGQCPFKGESALEILFQQLKVPPPPLRQKNPTVPPEVEEVVLLALEKDPQKRFGSVKAFATALDQAILG